MSEFTEARTTSEDASVDTSLSLGLGVATGKTGSTIRESQVQSAQVLSKAIIQTHFRELYELERDSLLLRPSNPGDQPGVGNITDLEEDRDSLMEAGWLIDAQSIRRGSLLELDVELEADPIFRGSSRFRVETGRSRAEIQPAQGK